MRGCVHVVHGDRADTGKLATKVRASRYDHASSVASLLEDNKHYVMITNVVFRQVY